MHRYWTILALSVAMASGQTARSQNSKSHAERAVQPAKPLYTAAAINQSTQAAIAPGAKGSAVVRLQILLARAHFSCGEIDGNFGVNLRKALSAFQQERGMPALGRADSATWQALDADTAPMLVDYEITQEDERGPFTQIPNDLVEQAQLAELNYASPLEEIAEHFHVSPEVLQSLNPGADYTKPGQTLTVPNVIVMPPAETAAKVVVTKSESSVRAYDASGKLIAFYSATIGSEHDPLPVGDWKIVSVTRNPIFHYDAKLFWDAKQPDAKAEIRPGPNNPVGLVWMDLSKPHYGIHGTPEPSAIGHTTSHGCIRLTNWDALELASMVKAGTPAVLQE